MMLLLVRRTCLPPHFRCPSIAEAFANKRQSAAAASGMKIICSTGVTPTRMTGTIGMEPYCQRCTAWTAQSSKLTASSVPSSTGTVHVAGCK